MIKVVNLKENNNSFEYAIHLLDTSIYDAKKLGFNIIIAIHGYGSHGAGGIIKAEVMDHLLKLKRNKIIKNYVQGNKWSDNNEVVKAMISASPDLIVSDQIKNFNPGITVVWIQ